MASFGPNLIYSGQKYFFLAFEPLPTRLLLPWPILLSWNVAITMGAYLSTGPEKVGVAREMTS